MILKKKDFNIYSKLWQRSVRRDNALITGEPVARATLMKNLLQNGPTQKLPACVEVLAATQHCKKKHLKHSNFFFKYHNILEHTKLLLKVPKHFSALVTSPRLRQFSRLCHKVHLRVLLFGFSPLSEECATSAMLLSWSSVFVFLWNISTNNTLYCPLSDLKINKSFQLILLFIQQVFESNLTCLKQISMVFWCLLHTQVSCQSSIDPAWLSLCQNSSFICKQEQCVF